MATKSWLKKHEVDFEERNISENNDYHASLLKMGYKVTPVIVIGDETIVGFSPTKLMEVLSIGKEAN